MDDSTTRVAHLEVDEHLLRFFQGEHRFHGFMHVLCFFGLPLCIRAFEYEKIQENDKYADDRGEECCNLRASSE